MALPVINIRTAVAGLLPAIVEFARRAAPNTANEDAQSLSFMQSWVPTQLRNELLSSSDAWKFVQEARRLLGERADQPISQDARLSPALTRVSLKLPAPQTPRFNRLTPLSLDDERLFPVDLKEALETDFSNLWDGFIAELNGWKQDCGSAWDTQSVETYFVTLLALARKYLWCVPASSPDVSLNEQMRLTSALAVCLSAGEAGLLSQPNQPVAIVFRGDVSGIQNFIYRIAQPGRETAHIAKRLRGRSFYLTLLVEVVVDWLLRTLGLPASCVLFVGGGRFDLLLPLSASGYIGAIITAIDAWLLDAFQGELSLQFAETELTPADLNDMRAAYRRLEDHLSRLKRNKWHSHLAQPEFFEPDARVWNTCPVCELTPLREAHVCPLCSLHEDIGRNLPHATHLVFVYGSGPIDLTDDQVIQFQNAPFDTRVAMVRGDIPVHLNRLFSGEQVVYSINHVEEFIVPGLPSSFRFMGNAAPKALRRLHVGTNPVNAGDVLHFEALADLSTGANRLGVLKADVDHMGLVMSSGLEDAARSVHPTIARAASLSAGLDLFFAGLLNNICQGVFEEWRSTDAGIGSTGTGSTGNASVAEVDGVFYIIYSGGDDLFVVGPWDAILLLARRLSEQFGRFCGENPNLTISAGYLQVKSRYPVQKFAEHADDAERAAKNAGRNCISAFSQILPWQGQRNSYVELLHLAERLNTGVADGSIHRSVVSDLGRLLRQHSSNAGKITNPMWTPRLFYTLARRVSRETFDDIGAEIVEAMRGGKIMFPVSIVSLTNRKE